MGTIDTNFISNFVKYNRDKLRITQDELAAKAGVGLRFIRDLEQGKVTLRLDKVNQVLRLFGFTLSPGSARRKDPYDILLNHTNKSVHISLKNKQELWGIIIAEIRDGNEIRGWRFVSNNNAIAYQKKKSPKREKIILHDEIENIDNL
jgi:y4mF family transcriptional regulator